MQNDLAIAYSDIRTPLGGSLEETYQAVLREQSIDSVVKPIAGESDFPVKYSAAFSEPATDWSKWDNEEPTRLRAERILEPLLDRFLQVNDGKGIDAILIYGKVIRRNSFSQFFIRNYQKEENLRISDNFVSYEFLYEKLHPLLNTDAYRSTLNINDTCASGNSLLSIASQWIKYQAKKRILVLAMDWNEAPTLQLFYQMGILANQKQTPGQLVRPFDATRSGFIKTEACGLMVIEKNADPSLPHIVGYANNNDAALVAGIESQDSILQCMEQAMEMAQVRPEQVGAVKAHGTGTRVNDHKEAAAISNLFTSAQPGIFSLKGYLGHTTDASGLVELSLCLRALKDQVLFKALNSENLDVDLKLPAKHVRNFKTAYLLSNNFGFGGNNSCVLIRTAIG